LNNPDYKPNLVDIPCTITDSDDGFYHCEYQVEEEGPVDIDIKFLDDKERMVPIRGCPMKASFSSKAGPKDNLMTGTAMDRNIKKELERLNTVMLDSKKEIVTKDKDLKDVKVLLNVKERVEHT